jgi:hypothetical protein
VVREGINAAGNIFSAQSEGSAKTQQIDASARAAALLQNERNQQIATIGFALVAALGVYLVLRQV